MFKLLNKEGRIEIRSKFFYWTSYLLLSRFLLGSFILLVEGAPHQNVQIKYAMVFDAGSTATKVSTFKLHSSPPNGQLSLHNEDFDTEPKGLSNYCLEPEKAAESIVRLLNKAKARIPKEFWPSTTLVLKATAGLRLLKPAEAENLLNVVRDVFSSSGFLVPANAVEVINGADEGIFAWLTANILLGHLDSVNLGSRPIASLDLGGGSTQVTFGINDPNSAQSLANFTYEISTSNAKMNVFTNSYLNLGLQAVRHAIFTSGITKDGTNFESDCINPGIKSTKFTYQPESIIKTYHLSGKNNSKSTGVDVNLCMKRIEKEIMPSLNARPVHLNGNEITAGGYFIERSIKSGIVREIGGEPTVGQYLEKAKEVCAQVNEDQPFLCFDLLYISTLLTKGYGLNADKKIHLYRRMNGYRTSWAFGCACSLHGNISINRINDIGMTVSPIKDL